MNNAKSPNESGILSQRDRTEDRALPLLGIRMDSIFGTPHMVPQSPPEVSPMHSQMWPTPVHPKEKRR